MVRIDAREPGTPIPSGPPRRDDDVATGTGFVIDDDGSIVTNDHVAAGGAKCRCGSAPATRESTHA